MSAKRKTFGKKRVFKAPVTVGRETITITFPKTIIDYLNLTDGEVFWAPVNGVVQVSGQLPHMVIPMISVSENGFIPQDAVVEEEI